MNRCQSVNETDRLANAAPTHRLATTHALQLTYIARRTQSRADWLLRRVDKLL